MEEDIHTYINAGHSLDHFLVLIASTKLHELPALETCSVELVVVAGRSR